MHNSTRAPVQHSQGWGAKTLGLPSIYGGLSLIRKTQLYGMKMEATATAWEPKGQAGGTIRSSLDKRGKTILAPGRKGKGPGNCLPRFQTHSSSGSPQHHLVNVTKDIEV